MSENKRIRTVVVTASGTKLNAIIAQRFANAGDHVVNLSDASAYQDLITRLSHEGGQIDVWINVTPLPETDRAEHLQASIWDNALNTTLSGTFYACQAVGRHMLKHKQGVIINLASIAGYAHQHGAITHSVVMAGMIAMTQALGVEWAARGVRVAGVAIAANAATPAINLPRIPMRRVGTLDEIAEAIYFLASDEASYIVGETLKIDGGYLAYQLF